MGALRVPSPGSIRAMREQMKTGVTEEQRETIDELLESARSRILAALPAEALTLLETIDPLILESYALLQQELSPVILAAQEGEQNQAQGVESRVPSTSAVQGKPPSITPLLHRLSLPDDGDGLEITVTAENAAEQAFLSALTGMQAQAGGQVPRGGSLRVVPPVTPTMILDAFQHAYHGLVEVQVGTKKKPRSKFQTIGVLQTVFEEEQQRIGARTKDPAYWLPKINNMSVYLLEELERSLEVGWILGDYNPQLTGIPAGVTVPPEQIMAYLSTGDDDWEWSEQVIKKHLRTSEQKAWLDGHDLTIADCLEGRTPFTLEAEMYRVLFDPWNAKLGVKVFGF